MVFSEEEFVFNPKLKEPNLQASSIFHVWSSQMETNYFPKIYV